MFLIRYAEIGIKSNKTRRRFVKKLVENIKRKLSEIGEKPQVTNDWSRIYIDSTSKKVEEALKKVFGIASFSLVEDVSAKKEEILNKATEYATRKLINHKTFAVRCRRVGEHPYTSKTIETECGTRIIKKFNGNLKVNLTNPDKTIHIEIRSDKAYIYDNVISGLGGLPLSSQGKFVSLFSGGIDSPIATYMMMKRGTEPVLLYCDNSPYSSEETKKRALKAAKVIQSYASGRKIKFYVAPYGVFLEHVVSHIRNRKYTCIICKRGMIRLAERIAEIEKADAIVTGESIGQKATQTLRNARVIRNASKENQLIRPVIALDKLEIEDISRRIGLLQITSKDTGKCNVVPRYPSVNADAEFVTELEQELLIEEKINEVIEKIKLVMIGE